MTLLPGYGDPSRPVRVLPWKLLSWVCPSIVLFSVGGAVRVSVWKLLEAIFLHHMGRWVCGKNQVQLNVRQALRLPSYPLCFIVIIPETFQDNFTLLPSPAQIVLLSLLPKEADQSGLCY